MNVVVARPSRGCRFAPALSSRLARLPVRGQPETYRLADARSKPRSNLDAPTNRRYRLARRALSADELAAIRETRLEVFGQWTNTEPGNSLDLEIQMD